MRLHVRIGVWQQVRLLVIQCALPDQVHAVLDSIDHSTADAFGIRVCELDEIRMEHLPITARFAPVRS